MGKPSFCARRTFWSLEAGTVAVRVHTPSRPVFPALSYGGSFGAGTRTVDTAQPCPVGLCRAPARGQTPGGRDRGATWKLLTPALNLEPNTGDDWKDGTRQEPGAMRQSHQGGHAGRLWVPSPGTLRFRVWSGHLHPVKTRAHAWTHADVWASSLDHRRTGDGGWTLVTVPSHRSAAPRMTPPTRDAPWRFGMVQVTSPLSLSLSVLSLPLSHLHPQPLAPHLESGGNNGGSDMGTRPQGRPYNARCDSGSCGKVAASWKPARISPLCTEVSSAVGGTEAALSLSLPMCPEMCSPS
jgi:hypothetical protein